MRVLEIAWSHPAGEALRARQRAEIAQRYQRDDSEPGKPPSAEDISVFVLAEDAQGTPLGCGGLRHLGGPTAEVKRMYVVPEARGQGAAVAILRALETWALDRGWTTLRLETGTLQPEAIRFYTREGYARIPNFGPYEGEPLSLCFERHLSSKARTL
ncbi:GNAT family N-acetyltransferase [Stigmatella aurantiaca]|uniref:GCN5-like N-acetyltransferase n=1 Tax=Stigmatella aurantiaca (strain DW4/3-1) TaxID=378806 RepID=Q09AI9_STIAD|nr:GNAT family N-acetyltransferase [Stigmatella aurantiaca]ADO68040.1 GCN5-like N-acetyltransferase [Stigmatella aurantiaca DW4/3-1]EAU68744.1 IAA acetyltransferase [Stigmatella aurantiaca DW4/3-1]